MCLREPKPQYHARILRNIARLYPHELAIFRHLRMRYLPCTQRCRAFCSTRIVFRRPIEVDYPPCAPQDTLYHIVATEVLLDGALGYLPDGRTEVVFSLVLGGQTAGQLIRSDRVHGGSGATPAQNLPAGGPSPTSPFVSFPHRTAATSSSMRALKPLLTSSWSM